MTAWEPTADKKIRTRAIKFLPLAFLFRLFSDKCISTRRITPVRTLANLSDSDYIFILMHVNDTLCVAVVKSKTLKKHNKQ